MCWSDIPIELLVEINKRLDLVDVIRTGAVCSWWSSVPDKDKYVPRPQIPWLMLSSKDNPNSRYFYSLTEKKTYEFNLPDIAGQHCAGSCHGYIISIDNNADLVATNPLNPRSHLPLLPTSSFPETNVIRDSYGRIIQYEMETNDAKTSYFVEVFYRKAILSPDRKIVVVITLEQDGSLAFARSGDKCWTPLEAENGCISDMIFHKGHLYAIDMLKALFIFNFDRMSGQLFRSPVDNCLVMMFDKMYLVSSPCGDKLFMVSRIVRPISAISMDHDTPRRTKDFEVFVLDEVTNTWKPIYTLGELSFFVGFNYSLSLLACDFPGLKKNCIYFTDDNKEYYTRCPETVGDNGVFNLDDGSTEPLYDDRNLDQLNWPPPVWFLPTIF